jgi:hypothetical protein
VHECTSPSLLGVKASRDRSIAKQWIAGMRNLAHGTLDLNRTYNSSSLLVTTPVTPSAASSGKWINRLNEQNKWKKGTAKSIK